MSGIQFDTQLGRIGEKSIEQGVTIELIAQGTEGFEGLAEGCGLRSIQRWLHEVEKNERSGALLVVIGALVRGQSTEVERKRCAGNALSRIAVWF